MGLPERGHHALRQVRRHLGLHALQHAAIHQGAEQQREGEAAVEVARELSPGDAALQQLGELRALGLEDARPPDRAEGGAGGVGPSDLAPQT